jgi:hypothetical protein
MLENNIKKLEQNKNFLYSTLLLILFDSFILSFNIADGEYSVNSLPSAIIP